jgi:hypothetical protein
LRLLQIIFQRCYSNRKWGNSDGCNSPEVGSSGGTGIRALKVGELNALTVPCMHNIWSALLVRPNWWLHVVHSNQYGLTSKAKVQENFDRCLAVGKVNAAFKFNFGHPCIHL